MWHCCQRCGEPAGIGKHCRHTPVHVPPAAVRLIPLQPVKHVFSAASLLLSDGHRKKKRSDLTPDLCCTILSFLSDFRIPVSDRFCQICFCCSLSLLMYHIPSCAALCLKHNQPHSKMPVSEPVFIRNTCGFSSIICRKNMCIHLGRQVLSPIFRILTKMRQKHLHQSICLKIVFWMQYHLRKHKKAKRSAAPFPNPCKKRQTKWQSPHLAQFGNSAFYPTESIYTFIIILCLPFVNHFPHRNRQKCKL